MQHFELPDFYVPWPARLNQNLDVARIYSKAWAQEMGILDGASGGNASNIWSEQSFEKHDYALFCAYIHPDVPVSELNLMTAWNVWAFYVDDYFLHVYKRPKDRAGAKKYLDRVLLFMPVDLSPAPVPTNPMERGLTDLWLRTAITKSEAWRGRIAESMRNLLEAFLWELDSMSRQRLANPIEYIEMRRQVGAALWSADLVEHAMFVEIPDRIATTRPIQVLKNTFADAVHLRNDIFSYEREVVKDGELTNAVLVIERFLGVDVQRSVNLVNDMLTSRLQQFEQTALTELLPMFQEYALTPIEQADVLTYIRGLQDWQSGAHEWHIQTSRYLHPSATAKVSMGDDGLVPSLKTFGTSAKRIVANKLGLLNRSKNYMHEPYKTVGPTLLPKFYMPYIASTHNLLEAARKHEKEWAYRMGMLDTLPGNPDIFIWDEQRFVTTDLAFFNAMAHPTATPVQLDLVVDWVVWGTYTDDYFMALYMRPLDMLGAKIFHARLSDFMPVNTTLPLSVPLSPVERGLADLWTRVSETMTEDERHLFRKVIEDLIASWVWELSNRMQSRIPDFIDYVEMRRISCGSGIMIALPRAVHGQAIPPEVHRTLIMEELNNAAIDYGHLTNDIFSYQKEIEFEGDVNNGVLVIQNFLGCNPTQAIQIANELMTARMKQFEYLVAIELPVLFENLNLDNSVRQQVLAYAVELQNYMCGSLLWHIKTDRYRESEFRRSAKMFTGSATGLGTVASRISKSISRDGVDASTIQPTISTPLEIEQAPRIAKSFAASHLLPPFSRKKEEAQSD